MMTHTAECGCADCGQCMCLKCIADACCCCACPTCATCGNCEMSVKADGGAMSAAAKPKEERPAMSLTKLAKILALSDDAGEAAIVEAAATLKARCDSLAAASTEATTALAAAHAKIEAHEQAAKVAKLDGLIEQAKADGKILPKLGENGERLQSDLERSIRDLAAISPTGAEAFLAQLPRVAPLGAGTATTPPPTGDKDPKFISETEKKIAEQLGVTDEEYRKFKAERYNPERCGADAKEK